MEITNERLKEIKAEYENYGLDKARQVGLPVELYYVVCELLSARQTIAEKDKLIERLVEGLKGFAKFGTRVDTNPTVRIFDVDSVYATYDRLLKSGDKYVREKATDLMKEIEHPKSETVIRGLGED